MCLLRWHWGTDTALPCPLPFSRGLSAARGVDAVHHSEQGVGLASSSNAAHIRIWGNETNALPLLGAPGWRELWTPNICSQLPKMCLSHRWAAGSWLPHVHRA